MDRVQPREGQPRARTLGEASESASVHGFHIKCWWNSGALKGNPLENCSFTEKKWCTWVEGEDKKTMKQNSLHRKQEGTFSKY